MFLLNINIFRIKISELIIINFIIHYNWRFFNLVTIFYKHNEVSKNYN